MHPETIWATSSSCQASSSGPMFDSEKVWEVLSGTNTVCFLKKYLTSPVPGKCLSPGLVSRQIDRKSRARSQQPATGKGEDTDQCSCLNSPPEHQDHISQPNSLSQIALHPFLSSKLGAVPASPILTSFRIEALHEQEPCKSKVDLIMDLFDCLWSSQSLWDQEMGGFGNAEPFISGE